MERSMHKRRRDPHRPVTKGCPTRSLIQHAASALPCALAAWSALTAAAPAEAAVLNPDFYPSQGVLDTTRQIRIDTNARTLEIVGLTGTINGMLGADNSVIFVFDQVNISGKIIVTGGKPFQILSQGDLRFSSGVRLGTQFLDRTAGYGGGAQGGRGGFAESTNNFAPPTHGKGSPVEMRGGLG